MDSEHQYCTGKINGLYIPWGKSSSRPNSLPRDLDHFHWPGKDRKADQGDPLHSGGVHWGEVPQVFNRMTPGVESIETFKSNAKCLQCFWYDDQLKLINYSSRFKWLKVKVWLCSTQVYSFLIWAHVHLQHRSEQSSDSTYGSCLAAEFRPDFKGK